MNIVECRMSGDCLEGLGIPSSGIAVIDKDAEPRLFDVVHCNDSAICINGYLKELVRTGDHPIVRTRYLDPSRGFLFLSAEIYGVLLQVLDEDRNVVWERPPDPVEYAPIRHAAWKFVGVSAGRKIYRCTDCKALSYGRGNYCSFCGAQMDGGEIDG